MRAVAADCVAPVVSVLWESASPSMEAQQQLQRLLQILGSGLRYKSLSADSKMHDLSGARACFASALDRLTVNPHNTSSQMSVSERALLAQSFGHIGDLRMLFFHKLTSVRKASVQTTTRLVIASSSSTTESVLPADGVKILSDLSRCLLLRLIVEQSEAIVEDLSSLWRSLASPIESV